MIKNLAQTFGTSEQMIYYFAAGFVAFIILMIIVGVLGAQIRAKKTAEFEASIAGFAPEKQVELRLLRQSALAQERTANATSSVASAEWQRTMDSNNTNRY
jgi:hypothetical protein